MKNGCKAPPKDMASLENSTHPRRPSALPRAFALLFLGLTHCTALTIATAPGRPATLAAPDAECSESYRDGQWAFGFGALPLNDPLADFRPDATAIRITERFEWYDLLVTVAGGWAVSLVRKSVVVENCGGDSIVLSRAEYARLQNPRGADLGALAARASAEAPVVVQLADGRTLTGRILEISPADGAVTIDVVSGPPSAPMDIVELRNGAILRGRITSQSAESLRITTAHRTESINKSDIRRIRLNVVESGRGRRVLGAAEIKRIVFAAETDE